ncbi:MULTISPECIES: Asp23/Gls24 family envelope stress response protein [unclassified Streptomyces]|uniref:Asp23/Gls24 family envelope stress response protein n=1 Tax=unclassified Streptomyces TaxID=2593676 RepID=UPI0022B6F44A|nr:MULTISPECIES: Asp23/Gls24 family envelope stress response protein [unclassified Streptomyces]MCZ7413566.1 Asp23/Gls24 family envelope stress response protein [Streptomyces sp. WMMC897]MCZ7430561.1 Asp23/Gls24 family envelope stress response protein [Streptomyces sp. WMMC1477]
MALERVPAAERGATRVADKVIAKIAAQAAHEALRPSEGGSAASGSAGTPRSSTTSGPAATGNPDGTPPAPPGGRARHATVTSRARSRRGGEPDTARLRVAVELGYPGDIGAQCRAVRRRVIDRVAALAGFAVPEVAIDVERLNAPHPAQDRAGRVE